MMRHMRVLLFVVWILGSGCSTSSDPAPKTPDEFELTEWPTLDDGSLYPDYPVATPSVVTPERIEYEAGQLLWARPDHRVVFHRAAEIATYSPEHPGYPDFYIDQRATNGPPNAIGEYVPSYLWFPALTSMGKSRRDVVAWEPVSYPGSRAFRSTSSRRSTETGSSPRLVYTIQLQHFICSSVGSGRKKFACFSLEMPGSPAQAYTGSSSTPDRTPLFMTVIRVFFIPWSMLSRG